MTARLSLKLFGSLIALAVSLSLNNQAAAQQYQPAQFADTLTYVKEMINLPKLSPEMPVAAVYCQTDVAVDGSTNNVVCYEKEGFDELRRQTVAVMTGRSFTPARVDGKAVPVRMYFRLIFSRLDGQPPVMLLPNLGNMQARHGHDYIAPQERLDHPQWYQAYRANDWSEGELFFSSKGHLTRILAMINTDGETIAVRRIEAHGRHKRDAVEIEKALKNSRFIPGFAEGKREPMRYVAVLHYSD